MNRLKDLGFGRQGVLGRALLIHIVLFSSMMTLFTTAIQLYSDYRQDVAELIHELKLIETIHLETLTESVWIYSDKLVMTQLKALKGLPGVKRIAISNQRKNRWAIGEQQVSAPIQLTFALIHTEFGHNHHLGNLHVTASFQDIYRKLIQKAGLMILTNGVKTFFVAGFILFIIRFLMIRHLESLADFARREDVHRPDVTFEFDRAKSNGNKQDELDDLLNSFNQMRHNLNTTIREQVEAEKKAEQAESANRTKSEFLTNMSHELRTPLNAILGFSQLMAHGRNLNRQQHEYIGIINRNGVHLLGLINNVLDMSKLEAGQITTDTKDFNLDRFMADLKNMFEMTAKKKGLFFSIFLDESLPKFICTDEQKLRQVLINIVNNALKFTEKGDVTVRATAGHHAPGGSQIPINFSISDTGFGMTPEELNRVFKPFVQAGAAGSAVEGTGLGLSISKRFVELMGGEIRAESQIGGGSVFQFTIQVQKGNAPCYEMGDSCVDNGPKVKTTEDTRRPDTLGEEMIRTLPAEWIDSMRQAIVDVSPDRVQALIDQLRERHPDLAHIVQRHMDRFDHEKILRWLGGTA